MSNLEKILKHIEEREKHAASVSAKFVTPASIDENQSLWQKTIEALTPVIKLNNSNQDKTKQDIESIATDLEIPFLLHIVCLGVIALSIFYSLIKQTYLPNSCLALKVG